MQPLSPSQPDLPIAWTQVLDQLEETLRRTEAEAAARERAIHSVCPPSETEKEGRVSQPQSLPFLEKHEQARSTTLQQAEKEAKVADTVLHAGEEALRLWLRAALALEQRLAKGIKPEV